MFTPEQLFIYNFEKLIRCHDNPTLENLFEAVGPLRRLLLDHPSITSLANRRAQLKFRFTIYSDPTMRINYDPKIHPSIPEIIKTMTLAEFLRHPLMQFSGTDITVKTAINYVRDYAGLEHKNEPDSDTLRAAQNVNWIGLGGMPAILYCLKGAVSLTLQGYEPLYRKLKGH
ncbi:hypothetical protein [Bradyrhizobium sp. B120]|uniref:hypothetical protein n=1 Tax=Bradyrhizobium sp. B120 TaxID=3410088 RepID=UPI003B97FA75